MTGPLNVIHILASHKWTGPSDSVTSLCRALRDRGHWVRLFCRPHPYDELTPEALRHGVKPEGLLKLKTSHPLALMADFIRLRRLLITDRPDILHLHLSPDHVLGGLAGWAAGSSFTGRIVRTIHHPDSLKPRPFRFWFYRSLTDGFITLCRADRHRLIETYRVDPTRVMVIHGAVDTKRFHPDIDPRPIRAEFGVGNTTPVVGMVARFQPHRRHDVMLKAMVRLQKLLPTVRLLLVGRGEHQPALERLVRDRGLQHRVVFTGYRDRDLPQVYAAMDVLVLLASGSDGSCRAVLEAMAVGRPVVAFPVGALPETIVEGATGHLVSEGDAEKLADCLAALLSDQPRLRAMGEAARKRIEAEFTEALRVQRTEEFYRSVLENPPRE